MTPRDVAETTRDIRTTEISAARPGCPAGIVDAGLSRGLAECLGSTLVVPASRSSRYAVPRWNGDAESIAAQIIGQLSSLEIDRVKCQTVRSVLAPKARRLAMVLRPPCLPGDPRSFVRADRPVSVSSTTWVSPGCSTSPSCVVCCRAD